MYDKCDADGSGSVSYAELAGAVKALGVKMPEIEMRELMMEMIDSSTTEVLSFEDFTNWWKTMVPDSPVLTLHTEAELDQVRRRGRLRSAVSGQPLAVDGQRSAVRTRPCQHFPRGGAQSGPQRSAIDGPRSAVGG